mmetsp:Transcript_38334/g.65752  ORF Transcript_38334/g.65752 Transcript_38334/m.65752 type:complete len:269 (-) Transcript_38334:484-1290(-)
MSPRGASRGQQKERAQASPPARHEPWGGGGASAPPRADRADERPAPLVPSRTARRPGTGSSVSAEPALREVFPKHDLVDAVQYVRHVLRIGGRRFLDEDLLVLVLADGLELPFDELEGGRGVLAALVRREADREVDLLHLLREEVNLVEEQDDWLLGVPSVARDVKEVERLLETVLLDVLPEHLVVLDQRADEDDSGDLAGQVPLRPLHALPADVDDPKLGLVGLEVERLDGARRVAHLEDLLVGRLEGRVGHLLDAVEEEDGVVIEV